MEVNLNIDVSEQIIENEKVKVGENVHRNSYKLL